jgi:DNA polymerase-3 subunit delta
MKIAPKDVSALLKNPARYRAVLIYGVDEGQVRERRDQIVQAVASAPEDPFSTVKLESPNVIAEPNQLFESLSAMSLMGEPPVTIIREATDKLTPIITSALEDPACSNFLILTAGELKTSSSLRKLFEKEKNTACLACYADEGRNLHQTVRSFFQEHKIHASPDVIQLLCDHLGNDRAVTRKELEKIDLYLGEERSLTMDHLHQLLGENKTLTTDDLAQALLNGDTAHTVRCIELLMQEGQHAVALLRSTIRYTERLLTAKQHMQEGMSADQALSQLRPPVFFKQKPAMQKQLQIRSLVQLEKLLALLVTAEKQAKGTLDGELLCRQLFTLTSARMQVRR